MSIEANLRNVWKAAKSGKDGQIVSGVASGEEGVIRYLSFISSTGARQQHADQPARAANQSAQFLQSNPPVRRQFDHCKTSSRAQRLSPAICPFRD